MSKAATRKRTTTETNPVRNPLWQRQSGGRSKRPISYGANGVEAAGKFGGYLFDIGWRLAATVILFLWGGNWLDNKFGTKPWLTLTGFLLVIASFVLIVRQILQKIPREFGGLKNEE